ncbi:unnamed protein product [Pelagomonas calceolata]|uniref:Uncharacterized protein n=1 Tax=Pelagomonas calceolata TaxID=35677 RepID=A0A8J2T120_9STRA|nr:unnamed protein product [Pelagomonas calceolata]
MARLGNLLALLSTALLATESLAAKRTFAKKKGKTQMWITIIVVVGTVATRAEMVPSDAEINANGSSRTQVMLALLCALYCQCGDRIYTAGNNNRRNEQEPLIVEGKPIPPP